MLSGLKMVDGNLEAVSRFGDPLNVGDNVLYEQSSDSKYLWPATIVKISEAGISLKEMGSNDCTLIDPYGVFKEKFPSDKKVMI